MKQPDREWGSVWEYVNTHNMFRDGNQDLEAEGYKDFFENS